MLPRKHVAKSLVSLFAALSACALILNASPSAFGEADPRLSAIQTSEDAESNCTDLPHSSPFIPVDSWVYPAALRLYSLGYIDTAYLGMRPWTRASLSHILYDAADDFQLIGISNADPTSLEALSIYKAISKEIHYSDLDSCLRVEHGARVDSSYSAFRAITGTPLRDSYHLGSTIMNDYGRPSENGLNNFSGASGSFTASRFTLYIRGEFQGAPSGSGYDASLAQTISNMDLIPFTNPATGQPFSQSTIPYGTANAIIRGRLLEAYVSTNLLNHVISFGKEDEWLGPGQGGNFAYSNNAENIYALHINRIEPLDVPILSRLTGPFRYEFLMGPLRGHTYVPATATTWVNPGAPWLHVEKISFKPTMNLEFGFERSVIWGGKGHEPITLNTFLRSFFSASAPSGAVKNSAKDPGARFSTFNFSYRVPFLRDWVTLYTDSLVHDDVSPVDAPRRASFRPGIYLSHVPGLPKLDLRAEAVSTDPPISNSVRGDFMYYEGIQRQGYTNNGQIFGDWIGREDKGGQAWITYHLTANEWIQAGLRNQKAAKDFVAGGTTLNDVNFQVVKRLGKDIELNGGFSLEHWSAPIYLLGRQSVTTTDVQITWFPNRKIKF